MTIVLLSIVVVAIAMFAMAVGVMMSGRCLRGSCGGPEVYGPGGESLLCDDCPKRAEIEAAHRIEAARREADVVPLGGGRER